MFLPHISRRRQAMLASGAAALLLAACNDTTSPSGRTPPSDPTLALPSAAQSAGPSASTLFPCCNNIVFRRDSAFSSRIYTVNADGTGLRKLPVFGSYPTWSPDHSKIVFANGQIGIVNADGSGFRLLGEQGDINPSFSPDGQKIVFAHQGTHQSDILIMNVDGSNRQVLLKTPTTSETQPRYSPDGQKLAYMRTRKDATELVVWDLATNIHTVVASPANEVGAESWSPDSKRLAYSTGFFSAASCIVIVDATGGNRKNFPNGMFGCFQPTWSPDGTELAFKAATTTGANLYRAKVDVVSPRTRITLNTVPNVADFTPAWR
jgi:Tol biopolymer transport system component